MNLAKMLKTIFFLGTLLVVSSEDEHDETKLLHNTSQLKNGYI